MREQLAESRAAWVCHGGPITVDSTRPYAVLVDGDTLLAGSEVQVRFVGQGSLIPALTAYREELDRRRAAERCVSDLERQMGSARGLLRAFVAMLRKRRSS